MPSGKSIADGSLCYLHGGKASEGAWSRPGNSPRSWLRRRRLFSRLAGADEDRTLARLRALRSDLIDPTIAVHHGRIVKRTGDGSIIEFRSVVDAVRCAIEVQNAMVERNAGVPEDQRIEFRIGIHLGDVVEESDGDLMGDGVNIAARLEERSQARRNLPLGGRLSAGQVAARSECQRSRPDGAEKHRRTGARLLGRGRQARHRAQAGSRRREAGSSRPPPRLAALLVAVGAAAAAWYLTAGKPAATVASPPLATRSGVPTVAVLPFANVTGDPQYETADPAHRPEDEGRRQQCADLAHRGPLGGHGRRRRDRRRAAVECRLRRHRKPGGRRRRAARDLTTRRRSFRRAPLVSDDFARPGKAQHGGRRG